MRHEEFFVKKCNQKREIYAVDVFCGAGGLTNGLEKAGINVLLGIDIDPSCSFPYTANNKARFLLKSVEKITAQDLVSIFPKNGFRLIAGCAPCQTFSTYNQKASRTDKRWRLLGQFSRLVREVSPELVTMENVPKLMGHGIFKRFVKDLEKNGYHVDYRVVECVNYGIPQQRERLVLLASKLGPIEILQPAADDMNSERRTVQAAIGNLPPLVAGETCESDPLHQCSSLSPKNLSRIKASRPGGTWRDWEDDLVADCHKKSSGKTYPSVYGRMVWNEPSPTLTTQFYGFGNGRFGHPEQDRAISLREGAILQSFPPDYRFTPPEEPIHKKTVGRLIGNAVPVKLGEVIGKSILEHVSEYETSPRRVIIGAGRHG